MHIHIRGFPESTTERKIDDMARMLADVVRACATRRPLLHIHHRVGSADDPNMAASSGFFVWGRIFGKYEAHKLIHTLCELTMSLDPRTDLSHTAFDYVGILESRTRVIHKLNTLNINYECSQWRWDQQPTVRSSL